MVKLILRNACSFTMPFSGTIIHFDHPGLSDYYFIDPHWLYDLFCHVCTSPTLLARNKVDSK